MSNQINLLSFEKILQYQYEINDKLLQKLNKSIVFADYQFLEWFNLTVGIDQLIKKAGIINIKKFSSLEVIINFLILKKSRFLKIFETRFTLICIYKN